MMNLYDIYDQVLRMYLPDNSNGSRIVITTRESDGAFYVAGSKSLHHVRLLNKSTSWDLLCQIVFGEEENCKRWQLRLGVIAVGFLLPFMRLEGSCQMLKGQEMFGRMFQRM
ncbi:hypothetical protein SASPL_149797 [Salvia splendens]|uniref:NB-ARC domain-containing protein n=1 Tax=Salvia splendens TaxID=180675 RepID=A0A8X8W525_SALSN|nr:hypothetical protein SASPL_149797 [Salvia splendens]